MRYDRGGIGHGQGRLGALCARKEQECHGRDRLWYVDSFEIDDSIYGAADMDFL